MIAPDTARPFVNQPPHGGPARTGLAAWYPVARLDLLVTGGCPQGLDRPTSGRTARATSELYGPADRFDDMWRPEVDVITPVTVGSAVGLEGTFFTGLGEGSGGNGPQHSATNYPLVQLRRIDNEQTRFVPVDAVAGWSDSAFTSLPLTDVLPGPTMVTVYANAVPSTAEIVVVGRPGLGAAPGETHVDRPRVSSLHVSHGDAVDVTTTVRAGKAAVAHLVIRLYDGAREVAAAHVFHLRPRERNTVHQTFSAETGVRPLSVVVEAGSTEYQRAGPTLRVDCLPTGSATSS